MNYVLQTFLFQIMLRLLSAQFNFTYGSSIYPFVTHQYLNKTWCFKAPGVTTRNRFRPGDQGADYSGGPF